jgi:serine/threonine protein phosphatase PrpC
MTTSTCPGCGEAVGATDAFCEACGDPLGPVPEAVPRASDATTCPSCDAPAADATVDGYCGHCGRHWSPVREHEEHVDGPLAAVTDRGVSHWRNEDAVGIAWTSRGAVLVVCDGVSASSDPHLVSQAAVDAAVDLLRIAVDDETSDLAVAMGDAVARAQAAASAVPFDDDGSGLGPGACTFVAAVIRDGTAVFGSVGDSRAYWVDASSARQIGRDDSLAADLVASGRVTPEQALATRDGHAITKWLGHDAVDSTPTITRLDLPGPGLVLVVSDGLWNYTPAEADLHALVGPLGGETPLALARRMTAYAEDAGGADNITVAVGPYGLDGEVGA